MNTTEMLSVRADETVEPNTIVFNTEPTRCVLTITKDGKLVRGEGLSDDELTQGVFDCLTNLLPLKIAELRQRATRAEAALGEYTLAATETERNLRASNAALRAALEELVAAEDASIDQFTPKEINRIEAAMKQARAALAKEGGR